MQPEVARPQGHGGGVEGAVGRSVGDAGNAMGGSEKDNLK